MTDGPNNEPTGGGAGLPFGFKVPSVVINDPVEVGAFSFGSTLSFIVTYVITCDFETASTFSVPGGGLAFSVVRLARYRSLFSSSRRNQRLEAKVRWEVTRLQSSTNLRVLQPVEVQRLTELEAIVDKRLYEPTLMKDVLKRTELKRRDRRAIEAPRANRWG